MENIIDRIIIERNKLVDSAVIMEIQKIASENGIETKFILNERSIVNALKKANSTKPIKLATKKGDYICSCCGNLVGDRFLEISGEKVKIKENFCDICGQALDWSDTE